MLNTELLEQVKTYEWDQSREALTEVADAVKKAYGNDAETKVIEKQLLSVLESDATYPGKQFVCRQLRIIGTNQSVPTLSQMLTDEKASDMARYALENIPGEAVDLKLIEYLNKAEGNARIGIVNTLGERRCDVAAPMIARLVDNQDKLLSGAAISALGKIGGPNAMKALAEAKNKASGKLLLVALDAYLKCADQLVAEGKKAQALAIYKELQAQDLPKPIRSAALTGMINAAKQ